MNEPKENQIPNDIPRNAMASQREGVRTPEFKAARDELVLSIRGILDDAEGRANRGEAIGQHGVVQSRRGIVRTTIKKPEPGATTDSRPQVTEENNGAYYYHDQESGERSLVVVSDDKVTEINDYPVEQMVTGPEAGYTSTGTSLLASFTETLSDQSAVSAKVFSGGSIMLDKSGSGIEDGKFLGYDAREMDMITALWDQVRTDITGEA